jgi:hypothetical protein
MKRGIIFLYFHTFVRRFLSKRLALRRSWRSCDTGCGKGLGGGLLRVSPELSLRLVPTCKHNRAVFKPTRSEGSVREKREMRLILGIIWDAPYGWCRLHGNATASSDGKQMVNWDVVAKRVDAVTALAREGWKKIAG